MCGDIPDGCEICGSVYAIEMVQFKKKGTRHEYEDEEHRLCKGCRRNRRGKFRIAPFSF